MARSRSKSFAGRKNLSRNRSKSRAKKDKRKNLKQVSFAQPISKIEIPRNIDSADKGTIIQQPCHNASTENVKPTLTCQLAHDCARKAIVSSNIRGPRDLYKKIADAYGSEFGADQILFCTLDTALPEMCALLDQYPPMSSGSAIFAHLLGQQKEVELRKYTITLGITLVDNGAGRVFIKRIKAESFAAEVQQTSGALQIGDHIESINGESMVGKKHYQVAEVIKKISMGESFFMRLVSPMKFSKATSGSEFKMADTMTSINDNAAETLRFKSVGASIIKKPHNKQVLERINEVFDDYIGINDDDLALTVWEQGQASSTLSKFRERIDDKLGDMKLPDDVIEKLWMVTLAAVSCAT